MPVNKEITSTCKLNDTITALIVSNKTRTSPLYQTLQMNKFSNPQLKSISVFLKVFHQ